MPFKKGESGNPEGARIKKVPKGYRSWSGLLKEYSQKKTVDGQTYQQEIVKQLYKLARKGEKWAIECILDRLEGKAVQASTLDVTSDGKPISAQVNFVSIGAPPAGEQVKTIDAEQIKIENRAEK